MKKLLYLITGFCFGIYFSNPEILGYAIFVGITAVLVDMLVDEKEK